MKKYDNGYLMFFSNPLVFGIGGRVISPFLEKSTKLTSSGMSVCSIRMAF